MAKAKWIIAVAPLARYGEPFDIPEWSYAHACQTARRYRQHGWKACVVQGNAVRVPWFVRGVRLDELQVMARSSDEALMLARLKDEGYDTTQRA